MLQFGGLGFIDMRSLWHMDSLARSGATIGAALLMLALLVYATMTMGATDVGSVLHDVAPMPSDSSAAQPWIIIGASTVALLVGLGVTLLTSLITRRSPSRPPQ
jgi:CBS-domain-containing membrane protein